MDEITTLTLSAAGGRLAICELVDAYAHCEPPRGDANGGLNPIS